MDGFAWSSPKRIVRSPSVRRIASAQPWKSIPMPRRQLATSSGFRWTPASPPASVARMTGRRCWHRRSIASSSLVRNGACAASNPEPTCHPASGSGPPCAQVSARSPGWRLRASIVVRMKVLITGGSGYIGRHLSTSLVADGHEVVGLSRRPESAPPQSGVRFVKWDARTAEGAWVSELAGAQGIVNLAGASIGKGRWTRPRMAEILSSRLAATSAIVEAIKRTPADRRVSVLVNASGIDYYGDRGDELVTEESRPGDSFLARVSEQREVAKEIGRVMHRPAIVPAPAPLLRLVLGEQSQLLLHGRRAVPTRAEAAGYRFRFGGLKEALTDTLQAR